MTKKDKVIEPTPVDGEAQDSGKRSLIRRPLDTLAGIIAEACRVYRQMRDGKLDHQQGRSLVWCLSQMRGMVETQALERLEQRLDEIAPSLESRNHGQQSANRSNRNTH